MKRLLLAALAALALAAPAAAQTTRYVNWNTGNNTWDGTSATFVSGTTGPWKSMGHANTRAAPGMTIYVANGNYPLPDAPIPRVPGTANAWITYIGNKATPESVVVNTNIALSDPYISVSGFKFLSSGSFYRSTSSAAVAAATGHHDSVSWCLFYPPDSTTGSFNFGTAVYVGGQYFDGPTDNVVANCTFRGRTMTAECLGGNCLTSPGRTRRNKVVDSKFYLTAGGTNRPWYMRGMTDYTFERCDFRPTILTGQEGVLGLTLNSTGNKFTDCNFSYEVKDANSSGKIYMRDNSQRNVFTGCKFENVGPGELFWWFTGSGTAGTINGWNRYTNCTWKNLIGNGPQFFNGMNSDTLQGCVINACSSCLTGDASEGLLNGKRIAGNNLIANCTFSDSIVGGAPLVITAPQCNADGWPGRLDVRNCLIWNRVKSGVVADAHSALYTHLVDSYKFKLRYSHNYHVVWDTLAGEYGTRSIRYRKTRNNRGDICTLDQNCVFAPPFECNGDIVSRPAANPWLADMATYSKIADLDSASIYAGPTTRAGPKFTDSTRVNFNPVLLSGSGAIGMGEYGVNCGSYNQTDVTAPSVITDVRVRTKTQRSAYLEFTAPGDDATVGRCTGYEVKYSTAPITTEGEWDAATAFVTAQLPKPYGEVDHINVTGLTVETRYYFAVKGVDEAGNKGALSNAPPTIIPPPHGSGTQTLDP